MVYLQKKKGRKDRKEEKGKPQHEVDLHARDDIGSKTDLGQEKAG